MLKNYYKIIKKMLYMLIISPKFFFKRIFLELKTFILPVPKSSIPKKINGVLFRFDFDYSQKVKKMYFGSYESRIVEALKSFLKKGDTFIDVGANVGYLTAIAAGCVGTSGQVHSFEPVPEYFEKLKSFADENSQYKIKTNQFALGSEEKAEKIYIGGKSYIGNNTFFPELLDGIKAVETLDVFVIRLDKYIEERNINKITIIKIDVEGFEFPVLLGLEKFFNKCYFNKLLTFPLIICEICPPAYKFLGYKLEDLFEYMQRFNYFPFSILNSKKELNIEKIKKESTMNILFKVKKL